MSSFLTRIPVDVEAIKALLPPSSDIESVTWNKETGEVELRWGNDWLRTPFTYHTEFSVEQLKANKIPSAVQMRLRQPVPLPTPVTPSEVKHIDTPAKRGVKRKT